MGWLVPSPMIAGGDLLGHSIQAIADTLEQAVTCKQMTMQSCQGTQAGKGPTVLMHMVGGQGGNDFLLNGAAKGGILKRIRVWVGAWMIRGVHVELSNGESGMFGHEQGCTHEFTFGPGELIRSLSLWNNGNTGDRSRLGAIKFQTTHGREFFAKMGSLLLFTTEYKMDVGSGICVGVCGKAGDDIDCMGFIFVKEGQISQLENAQRPSVSTSQSTVQTTVQESQPSAVSTHEQDEQSGVQAGNGPTMLIHMVGGQGGHDFQLNGAAKGGILKRIRVWVGAWMIAGVHVELSNGESGMFGHEQGDAHEFTFSAGELIRSLSLWHNGDNGDRSGLGAIKFQTTCGREFFARMGSLLLSTTEYRIDVGSGICVGVCGKGGEDIHCMGFIFVKEGQISQLDIVQRPSVSTSQSTVQMTVQESQPSAMSTHEQSGVQAGNGPTMLIHMVGGQGGHDFQLNGAAKGGILKSIRVWVGSWMIRGIHMELSNGESGMFGHEEGDAHEFTFSAGELIRSLSLWDNGENGDHSRLGAIKFQTTDGREFFAKMRDRALTTEYTIDVGSGSCVGMCGKGGGDIDCMGFIFVKEGQTSQPENAQQPPVTTSQPTKHTVITRPSQESVNGTCNQDGQAGQQEGTGPTLPIHMIGGQGGHDLQLNGAGKGGILKRIRVWVGGWMIRGIQLELSTGESGMFGHEETDALEFTFNPGELIQSLSLWDNGVGSRVGAIKFCTTQGREFFAKMTHRPLTTENKIDVGSGICVGSSAKCGVYIHCLGFIFLKMVQSCHLENVRYPSLATIRPKVQMTTVDSQELINRTDQIREIEYQVKSKLFYKHSWSQATGFQSVVSCQVKAGVPQLVEHDLGFGFTETAATMNKRELIEERTKLCKVSVKVDPLRMVMAHTLMGKAEISLPYSATMITNMTDGIVLSFDVDGVYEGITCTTKLEVEDMGPIIP